VIDALLAERSACWWSVLGWSGKLASLRWRWASPSADAGGDLSPGAWSGAVNVSLPC